MIPVPGHIFGCPKPYVSCNSWICSSQLTVLSFPAPLLPWKLAHHLRIEAALYWQNLMLSHLFLCQLYFQSYRSSCLVSAHIAVPLAFAFIMAARSYTFSFFVVHTMHLSKFLVPRNLWDFTHYLSLFTCSRKVSGLFVPLISPFCQNYCHFYRI